MGRCMWIDLIMFGWLTCDAVTSSAHSSKCRGFLSMWRRWQLGKQKRGEIDLRTKLYNFVFKRVEYTLVNWHFLVFPPKPIWRTDLRLGGKTGLWRSCLDSLFASITKPDWGETYLNTAEKLRLIYLQCLFADLSSIFRSKQLQLGNKQNANSESNILERLVKHLSFAGSDAWSEKRNRHPVTQDHMSKK